MAGSISASGCTVCHWISAFTVSIAVYYVVSFVLHVVRPLFLKGSTAKLSAKYNKSGKAWAVVTGTTSGIGEAFVAALVKLGFNVLMVSRNEEKLRVMKDELSRASKNGGKIEYLVSDLAEKSVSAELAKFISSNEVSILVNNAGINTEYPKMFMENTTKELEDILNVNCRSVIGLTHAVLPSMIHRRCGLVINLSSLFGQINGPLVSAYSGSKAFVDSFTLSLSEELRDTGVRAFCSLPGFVVSNMSKLKRTSLTVISAAVCVEAILGQVAGGKLVIASPHWSHAAIGWALSELVPRWIRLRLIGGINRRTNKAAIRKAQKINNPVAKA